MMTESGDAGWRVDDVADILTIEQIRSRYDSEWVLIGEPELDESSRLLSGRVVFHSPSRDDVYRKAVELRLPHFAVRYLGDLPENMAMIL
jgi:hypothetical protein